MTQISSGDRRVRRRARPMAPDERRDVLVDATLRLLREHGRAVTTRQIAEAAGVAEGTIFRVFDTKEELVEAAIARAFEPGALIERIEEIDASLPLDERLTTLVTVLQQRFRATFFLMGKVGLLRPPTRDGDDAQPRRAQLHELMVRVVAPDAARLTVPPAEFVHRLRLLTFAGSHPHITDGNLLRPDDIVVTLLDGLRRSS